MLTKTVTDICRLGSFVTSNFDLQNQAREDFVETGKVDLLASILGVSSEKALEISNGGQEAELDRLAWHYHYMPDETISGWKRLPMLEQPFDDGPPMRWTPRLLRYVLLILSSPKGAPSLQHLAWRMDTTEPRLRAALRKYSARPIWCSTAVANVDLEGQGRGRLRSVGF